MHIVQFGAHSYEKTCNLLSFELLFGKKKENLTIQQELAPN